MADWSHAGLPTETQSFDPLTSADLHRAHDPAFVDGVLAGRIENGFGNRYPRVAQACLYAAGAMTAAAKAAVRNERLQLIAEVTLRSAPPSQRP